MNNVATDFFATNSVSDVTQAGGGSAVAGVLNDAKLIAFTNTPVLSQGTIAADLTRTVSPSISAIPVTWSSPRRDSTGDIVSESQLVSWQLGVSAAPESVTGVAVVDPSGTYVLLASMLPQAAFLTDVYSSLNVVYQYNASNPSNSTVLQVG